MTTRDQWIKNFAAEMSLAERMQVQKEGGDKDDCDAILDRYDEVIRFYLRKIETTPRKTGAVIPGTLMWSLTFDYK